MRLLLITFFLMSITGFAQSDKKGTIKVKKVDTVSSTIVIDTPYQFGTSVFYPKTTNIVKLGKLPTLQSSYDQIYDNRPTYPGGEDAQKNFINKTMVPPECARCKGIKEASVITVTINEDGTLSDIVVKKGFTGCKQCDEEAVRIVKLMPKWIPAQLDGKKIKIKWDVWIMFTYLK